MSESPNPRPPKSGFFPGSYLPRLWRAEPGPLPATAAGTAGEGTEKSTKKGAGGAGKGKMKKSVTTGDEAESGPKGVLLEETPVLDTIEARRTVRIIAGSVGALLLLIVGFFIVRAFTRNPAPEPDSTDESLVVVDVNKIRQQNETEAGTMLQKAREVASHGNSDLATSLLRRVTRAYPETSAAESAREALARPSQHKPLFPVPSPAAVESIAAASTSPKPSDAQSGLREAGTAAVAAPGTVLAPGPAPLPVAANPEAALAAKAPMTISRSPGVITDATGSASTLALEPPPARLLPAGYQARSGVAIDPSGWPREIVSSRDGAMLVLVPGGPFFMGRDGAAQNEAPAHLAKVSAFYIDKHEVTNRQFETFLKENGARSERAQALAREGGGISNSEDFPVVMVSAREARDYAEWAGRKLPTEAQWEKAARGTDHRLYPWGRQPPVWHKPRAPLQIDAVMSFPSDLSPAGAYDMAGNALEWTRDWYDSSAYAVFRGVTAEDPTGPTNRPPTREIAVRGSSRQWIITAREGIQENLRLPYVGFRCVLPVEGPDSLPTPSSHPEPAPVPGLPGHNGTPKKAEVPF